MLVAVFVVSKLYLTLHNPMDCSMPGLPVSHYILDKFTSIDSVMLSNHLILCKPLFLLPSIFPSTRVFSNESTHTWLISKCYCGNLESLPESWKTWILVSPLLQAGWVTQTHISKVVMRQWLLNPSWSLVWPFNIAFTKEYKKIFCVLLVGWALKHCIYISPKCFLLPARWKMDIPEICFWLCRQRQCSRGW